MEGHWNFRGSVWGCVQVGNYKLEFPFGAGVFKLNHFQDWRYPVHGYFECQNEI